MKKQQYIQLNSIILPLIMLLVLAGGLFVGLPLIQKTQVFKSKASAARGFISLQATRTSIEPNQTTEAAITLNPGGGEIVAADIVLSFDKNYLELTDIIPKPDSTGNRLTTFIPRDQNGFKKDRIIQTANSTGRIKFGVVCFSETGCPQGQTQGLDQNNPLAIVVFKALRQGNTSVAVLANPSLTTESSLFTRAKENIISNSQPLALAITQPAPASTSAPTQAPTTAPPPVSASLGLVNPSFENWSSGAGSGTVDRKSPDGWVLTPNDGYSFAASSHSGAKGWMRTAFGNGGVYAGGYQDVAVTPNTSYIISGWVYEPGGPMNYYRSEAGGNIDVRNRICAKTTSSQDINCFDSTEADPEAWQKLEVSFNSGSNTTIRVYFGTNISQETFWDDFNIRTQ